LDLDDNLAFVPKHIEAVDYFLAQPTTDIPSYPHPTMKVLDPQNVLPQVVKGDVAGHR
jgi:hypothetical protein